MRVAGHRKCSLKLSSQVLGYVDQAPSHTRCLCAGECSGFNLWWTAARPGARRHLTIGSTGQRVHSPTPSL